MTNKHIRAIHEEERTELIFQEYHPVRDSVFRGASLAMREIIELPTQLLQQTHTASRGVLHFARRFMTADSAPQPTQPAPQNTAVLLG